MRLTCSGSQQGVSHHKAFTPVALPYSGRTLQRSRTCRRVPRRAVGRSTSASRFWGAAPFLFTVCTFQSVQSWEMCFAAREGTNGTHTTVAEPASLPGKWRPGKQRWLLQPSLPSRQRALLQAPGKRQQTKDPSSPAPLSAANNGLLFPGSCGEKHRYFFLFCSANISCKLKPNIFRYLNKRGKKGILALTENNSLGALAGDGDAPGKVVGE